MSIRVTILVLAGTPQHSLCMLSFINVDHTRSLWLMLDFTVDTLKDVKPYTAPERLLLSTVKKVVDFQPCVLFGQ